MKKLTILFFCILSFPVLGQVEYAYYSKAEVKQDLNFAYEKLTNIHPLFLDDNKLSLYKNQFSKIENSVKDSMTQNELYLLLAPLFASLNDGHTGIIIPMEQRKAYSAAGGKSFPFFVDIINDSVYVSFFCGNDTSLFQNGEQILEINGINATEMVRNMEPLFSGNLQKVKQREIAQNFRFLIWMLYGFEDNYVLSIKDNQNNIKKLTVTGVTSTDFMKNIKHMPKTKQVYYDLQINQSTETAVLKIKSFADLNGFCAFADSAFMIIKEYKIQNLVIDIRNNGGGRSVVVDSLMNYLTDKNYAQYKKIKVRISPELKEHYKVRYPDRSDWINKYGINEFIILDHNEQKPDINNQHFDGKLFLLTNNLTFSAAATFAGVFKNLEMGTIIGEETGGTISYFGDFWFLSTPHSKITFYVSPKQFIQYGGQDYNKGVIPDCIVADTDNAIINYINNLIEKDYK
ncbi:S41 family peptidase [Saccharicrinis sp. FJH2]|uniref:S41 family peptidase n=1 Tax=Saccharicrinis sp. FJH65 TaxID=3344659 RepID=UPI0035F234B2